MTDQSGQQKSNFNLEAYLNRIGFTDARATNIETLQAVQCLHQQEIPFENFNPLLNQRVKLDISTLQEKMVQKQRGGYCLEHNILLYNALAELGFNVTKLGGRVLLGRADTAITSRTHMLLLVKLKNKRYIMDVGFGGLTPTAPLLLQPKQVQETPNEPYRLLEWEDGYLLQANIQDEWKTLYRFNLQPQYIIDYKVANWYVSTHPNSHFVNDLSVALAVPGRRYTLHNNRFSIHDQNQGTSKQKLSKIDRLYSILRDTFKIELSNLSGIHELLERVIHKE